MGRRRPRPPAAGRSHSSSGDLMFDAATTRRIRRAALLSAIASWACVAVLVAVVVALALARAPTAGLSVLARQILLAGVALCFALWALALIEAWPVRCPRCAHQLLVTYRLSGRGGATLRELYEQFWPRRLLTGAQTTCPNCAAAIELRDADGA